MNDIINNNHNNNRIMSSSSPGLEKLETFSDKQSAVRKLYSAWQQHEASHPFFQVFVNQAATEEEEEEQDTHL